MFLESLNMTLKGDGPTFMKRFPYPSLSMGKEIELTIEKNHCGIIENPCASPPGEPKKCDGYKNLEPYGIQRCWTCFPD